MRQPPGERDIARYAIPKQQPVFQWHHNEITRLQHMINQFRNRIGPQAGVDTEVYDRLAEVLSQLRRVHAKHSG